MPELVHGTAVAVAGWAVLLRGASGAGKSDLALRLITGRDRFPGLAGSPILVADDRLHVSLSATGHSLALKAPETIGGLLEVRGVGILRVPFVPEATLALVIELSALNDVPRLPDIESTEILGIPVPRLALYPFEASAPVKVLAALATVTPSPSRGSTAAKALASRRDTRQT